MHARTYIENPDAWKRITLIGDGADVVTVRAADASDYVRDVMERWTCIERLQ